MSLGSRIVSAAVLIAWTGIFIREGLAKEPPRVSSYYPRRLSVHPGEVVRLVCPVDPTPSAPPIVTWQHEGESIHAGWDRYRIQDDGRVLKILGVEMDDAGTFVCRAANGFGSVDVKHFLYVYGSNRTESFPSSDEDQRDQKDANLHSNNPSGGTAERWRTQVEIVPPFPGNVTVSTGGEAVFTCHAQGEGEPRIQWLKMVDVDETEQEVDWRPRNNHSLSSPHRQKYKIVEGSVTFPLRDGTYLNKLALHNVREKDAGLYICSTMNGRGFGYRSAYLNVEPSSVQSSDDRLHDDQFVAEGTFVPVVIATVTVIGAVFVVVTAVVICRRRFRRKSPSAMTPSGFATHPQGHPKTLTITPRVAGIHRCPPKPKYNPRQPYHPAMAHGVWEHIPQTTVSVVSMEGRFNSPYHSGDTSSECSSLFKPTPAPAATPIPPTEVDYPLQHTLVDQPFMRPYYYADY